MTQARDSDEQKVRALDAQERIAALKRDVPALRQLWSEHLIVNAPNNQVVVGRQAVLDTFVGAGVINFSKFERQIEFVRADGPFVFIMGLETVTPVADVPAAGWSPAATPADALQTSGKTRTERGGSSRDMRT